MDSYPWLAVSLDTVHGFEKNMSGFIRRLTSDDFLWDAIVRHLPARHHRSGSSFITFNCPVCRDYKPRCGVKQNNPGVGIHCFNCGMKTKWQPGHLLSRKMKDFLESLGMPERDIGMLNMQALARRSTIQDSPAAQSAIALTPEMLKYETVDMPKDAAPISKWVEENCQDANFIDVVSYMAERGDAIARHYEDLWWSPHGPHKMERRLLVPFRYEGNIVGWTGRDIDPDSIRRYDNKFPPNYLFNSHVLKIRTRQYAIIVEGVFDALAIDGLSTLGAKMNGPQATWVRSFGKKIIVCPDNDERGAILIDIALQQQWSVAFPRGKTQWWDEDIKDASDAAKRYGRLYTIKSIIDSAVSDPQEIRILKKMYF